MQTLRGDHSTASWLVQHPLSAEDRAAMTAMRATVESNKGKLQGIAARVPFDAIMEHVSAPAGVHYEADLVGGIPGWWCRPETARWASSRAHPWRMVQLGLGTGVSSFGRTYRCQCRGSDFRARLSACSGVFLSCRR
jgi:hypothetical protein